LGGKLEKNKRKKLEKEEEKALEKLLKSSGKGLEKVL
jgi:hypothetical protein